MPEPTTLQDIPVTTNEISGGPVVNDSSSTNPNSMWATTYSNAKDLTWIQQIVIGLLFIGFLTMFGIMVDLWKDRTTFEKLFDLQKEVTSIQLQQLQDKNDTSLQITTVKNQLDTLRLGK